MPLYQLRAVHDRFGRVVGFLDGHFVLGADRRVVAEVRFGAVVRFDGRVCGEYDGLHFFDRRRAIVATTVTTTAEASASWREDASSLGQELGGAFETSSLTVLAEAPRRTRWSQLDWHRYVEI